MPLQGHRGGTGATDPVFVNPDTSAQEQSVVGTLLDHAPACATVPQLVESAADSEFWGVHCANLCKVFKAIEIERSCSI